MTGLEWIHRKPKSKYANDKRHNFVRKIMEMFARQEISQKTPVVVAHQLTCAILQKNSRRDYCNCEPLVTPKYEM